MDISENNMSNRLTIVLALKDRVPFTLRWMRYANEERYPFRIILADGGTDAAAAEIFAVKSDFPNLNYEYIRYPADQNYAIFYKKISDALALVDTPYLLMADNDDFFCIDGLIKSMTFLDDNPDYVAARGNYLGFSIQKPREQNDAAEFGLYGKINLRGLVYPSITYGQESAADRLTSYFSAWSPNWYNVHRTDNFRSCWNQIRTLDIKDIFLMEHTLSSLLATKGKIFSGSYAYYYRQFGDQGVTASQEALRRDGDFYDRMLIESWSGDYASFLNTLANSIAEKDGIATDAAKGIAKRAYRTFMGPAVFDSLLTDVQRKKSISRNIKAIYRKTKKSMKWAVSEFSAHIARDGNRKLQYADAHTRRVSDFLLKHS